MMGRARRRFVGWVRASDPTVPAHNKVNTRISTRSGRRTPVPTKIRSLIQPSAFDAVSNIGTQRK